MSIFERSVTCSSFSRNCTHILTRTQVEKFEDMFLVKIASKITSLNDKAFKTKKPDKPFSSYYSKSQGYAVQFV